MLEDSFGESGVSVITIGESNKVRITTNYRIMENDPSLDDDIQNRIYNGVKSLLADDVTYDMFVNQYAIQDGVRVSQLPDNATSYGLQSSQKVGPTMADDIKTSAVWAVIFALIVIGLYILIRFRNIAFSLGAVVALIHDTFIIM
jgi:SecD/SecF fusion protein